MQNINILAISGSLRAASLNTALLQAVARLAGASISVELYSGLGELPLFNPDLEAIDPPAVAELRAKLLKADGVLIASPEYAHGVSGPMKNALDWMVGCEAFVYKPVALLNASPRAVHAFSALRETITVMSANLVEEACITVPLLGKNLDADGIANDPVLSVAIRGMLRDFQAAIMQWKSLDCANR